MWVAAFTRVRPYTDIHQVLDTEPENEITITVFRMLVLDLLAMFHVVNQGMINILGKYLLNISYSVLTDYQATSLRCRGQMRKGL
jgi:hypothetical protein